MRGKCVCVILLLIAASAAAQQAPGDLSGLIPKSGEVSSWTLSETPKNYHGDELFQMIDGGADIYHEYGFTQVLSAEFMDARGKSIKLEIYEMESPAAAYGIYTFKVGDGGKALSIGQDALLEDYYLNFWKGNLLVTVIGSDSEEETLQGVVAHAKTVDARIDKTGEQPGLAGLMLREPLAFSHAKYVHGPLGVMNSYIFDTQNIFCVREGMIGSIGDCQAFVFRYADEGESTGAFENATKSLSASPKFMSHALQGNQFSMVGRQKEHVLIKQTGRYIAIVIGHNQDEVKSTSDRLIEKLKRNGGFHGPS